MFATSNDKKMDCCRKIDGNKIFDISELFRCYFDLFSMLFFFVLSFYIMPFLYFCFSMFCRSMFRHRSDSYLDYDTYIVKSTPPRAFSVSI